MSSIIILGFKIKLVMDIYKEEYVKGYKINKIAPVSNVTFIFKKESIKYKKYNNSGKKEENISKTFADILKDFLGEK